MLWGAGPTRSVRSIDTRKFRPYGWHKADGGLDQLMPQTESITPMLLKVFINMTGSEAMVGIFDLTIFAYGAAKQCKSQIRTLLLHVANSEVAMQGSDVQRLWRLCCIFIMGLVMCRSAAMGCTLTEMFTIGLQGACVCGVVVGLLPMVHRRRPEPMTLDQYRVKFPNWTGTRPATSWLSKGKRGRRLRWCYHQSAKGISARTGSLPASFREWSKGCRRRDANIMQPGRWCLDSDSFSQWASRFTMCAVLSLAIVMGGTSGLLFCTVLCHGLACIHIAAIATGNLPLRNS